MTKYKEYVIKMIDENKAAFDEFRKLHDLYSTDEEKWQEKFNIEGEKILVVVREYEDRLCRQTEKGQFNVFSPKLSEKFQEEVKKYFPFIDHIGLRVESAPTKSVFFEIKKIKLV